MAQLAVLFAALVGMASAQAATTAAATTIAISPDVATGLFIGSLLVGLLIFALTMLDGIQASDKIGQNKPELTR